MAVSVVTGKPAVYSDSSNIKVVTAAGQALIPAAAVVQLVRPRTGTTVMVTAIPAMHQREAVTAVRDPDRMPRRMVKLDKAREAAEAERTAKLRQDVARAAR